MRFKVGSVLFRFCLLLIFSFQFFSCLNSKHPPAKQKFTYSFDKPEKIWYLPDELKEISGMICLNSDTFLCINDERGILYYFSLSQNAVVNESKFGNSGDYEAITNYNKVFYVASSSGKIYAVSDSTSTYKVYNTGLNSTHNIEGLAYYAKRNAFLIATKGIEIDLNQNMEQISSSIYIFYPEANKTEVFLKWDKQNLIDISGHKRFEKFSSSDMAIHPSDSSIYILSSAAQAISVFDDFGNVVSLYILPKRSNLQAEGICFDESGNVFISNEGRRGSATIAKYIPQIVKN